MTETIDSAMDDAARLCSVDPPRNWIATSDPTHVEMRDLFLVETVDELLDRYDWPSPIGAQQTITGDGSETYDLNSNFLRLARDPLAIYESSRTRRAGVPINTDGEWTHIKEIGTAGSFRFYRIQGIPGAYTISFYRPLESSDTVTVSYVTDEWAQQSAANGGGAASAWTSGDDVTRIPRRIIALGVAWRFRKKKGFSFEAILAEYEMRLSRMFNDHRGVRRVAMGDYIKDYRPMRTPVPDFIPES